MLEQAKKIKKPVFLLPLLFIVAYILCNTRFYFFDDEFFTLDVCRSTWSNFLACLKATDVHPPLSYLFFKILFSIFGEHIWVSQAISVIFVACGLLFYLYVFTRLFPKINWLFALIAIHPLLILWAGSARYYPLLFFLFNLGMVFFIKIFHKDYSIKTLILYTVISVLGIYTEFMYFLGLIPQCLLILYSIILEKERKERLSHLVKFSLLITTFSICYIPWAPKTALLIFQNFYRLARPSAIMNLAYIIYGSFIGQSIMPYDFAVVIPAVIIFATLFVIGIMNLFKEKRHNFFIWLGLTSGALIFALPIRLITVRHFLFMPGLLLIPVLYSIASWRRKWLRYICIGIIATIFLYGDLNIALKKDIHKGGLTDPIGQIVNKVSILSNANKDAPVITYSHVLNYYFKQKKELSSRLAYLNAVDPDLFPKLYSIFRERKPSRIIYVWSYYGGQPDYKMLDNTIQRFLDETYVKVSELKINRDERLRKISKLISNYYMNPRGYRFFIQEYRLREGF